MAAIASPATEEDIEDAPDMVKSKPHALRAPLGSEREQEQSRGGRAGLSFSSSSANGEVPTLESVSLNEPRSNSDSDGSGSQTVLLRDRSGRGSAVAGLESLRLSSRTDFTQTDTFKVGGKTCTVTLEEDRITWAPKKASGELYMYVKLLSLSLHSGHSPISMPTYYLYAYCFAFPCFSAYHMLCMQIRCLPFACPLPKSYNIVTIYIQVLLIIWGCRGSTTSLVSLCMHLIYRGVLIFVMYGHIRPCNIRVSFVGGSAVHIWGDL